MAKPGLIIKKRLLAAMVIFTLVVILLLGRVGWIQFVQGAELQKMAYQQQNGSRIINPKRGIIYDRNYKMLAQSATVDTVSVNPKELKSSGADLNKVAQELAALLEMDEAKVYAKVTANSRYEYIKAKIDRDLGNKVREWVGKNNIIGVNVDEDAMRFYPNRNLAAHVIGFTGADNQGIVGIEYMMEEYLKGYPGRIMSETDASGRTLPFKEEKYIPAKDGYNVVLTIDETIQYLAEKAIEKAIDDNNVLEGASAIVMDPRNGDLLAMVSKPDYDLNDPWAAPVGVPGIDASNWDRNDVDTLFKTVWRNKAVQDTYEPGSTFKAITSAAAIEEGIVTPDTPTNDFPVTLGGWTINCWRRGNLHGNETFKEGVYNSCNPVFVKVAQQLGISTFYKYIKAFGFYDRTGISLDGEAKSIFHDKPSEVDMAVASFGQRFQITPLQLISAYSAIANGGKLVKPRLVSELTDSEGNVVKKFEPEVVRNVISKQTSETLKEILEGVVSIGTGKNAYVPGYRVAGKTGTSETKETAKTGRYIASFMAFAPADNPVICALVILDHPGVYPYTGGITAAPVAGKLVEDILNYLDVERRYTERDKQVITEEVVVPEVKGKSVKEAEAILKEIGLEYKVEGNVNNKDAIVVEQTPKQYASMLKKSVVILYTETGEQAMVQVPNLANKTVDEAIATLKNVGLNLRVNGFGNALKQSHEPGSLVPKGEIIEVEFRHLDVSELE